MLPLTYESVKESRATWWAMRGATMRAWPIMQGDVRIYSLWGQRVSDMRQTHAEECHAARHHLYLVVKSVNA